jgi:hypothetical protein
LPAVTPGDAFRDQLGQTSLLDGLSVQQSAHRRDRSIHYRRRFLPEITDLSKWWKGKHRYIDPEGQYVFIYQSTLYGPRVYSNTKLVNLDSLRSVWGFARS